MAERTLERRAVRAGFFAGIAVIYMALVGMIERFDTVRLLEDVLTLGRLLIFAPAAIAGYLLVRSKVEEGEVRVPAAKPGLAGGATAGVVGAALVGAFILGVNALTVERVRQFFVSVTPTLMSILTLGRAVAPGVALVVVVSGLMGAAGAGLGTTAISFRRPIEAGIVVVLLMAMLQDVFRVMLFHLHIKTSWLYSPRFGGLTYLGAAVVFCATALITAAVRRERRVLAAGGSAGPFDGSRRTTARLAVAAALALLLASLPVLLGPFLSLVLGSVGIFLLMGLGLNIVVGYAGLLDLGYVAFYAVGAYATGLLTASANSGSSFHPGIPFIAALPIVVGLAILVGLLIGGPVLRLRGDYLAIVTLGFGEIARVLITSDWLKPLLGGPQGLIGIPAPQINIGGVHVDFRNPQPFYYLALAACLVAVFVSFRLENSRIGRAWMAMREDEQVAEATGVSTVKYKLLAFGAGAAVGSLSGALFAVQVGSLSPASFTILVSIQALAVIILGGIGSIRGVIVGALFLIGLPGFLTEFQDFQLLIYGAALVAIMLLRPQGLLPSARRSRELQDTERSQDRWLATEEPAPAAEGSSP